MRWRSIWPRDGNAGIAGPCVEAGTRVRPVGQDGKPFCQSGIPDVSHSPSDAAMAGPGTGKRETKYCVTSGQYRSKIIGPKDIASHRGGASDGTRLA
jgi:hypothetical protein